VKDRLVDAAYGLGWAAVRGMPERLARAQFDAVADAAYLRGGRGVRRLRSNLRRVVGEDRLESTTRAAMRSYLRYWCEAFRLPAIPREEVIRRCVVADEHYLRDGYARGRGVILALPHMGNWDWAGAWLTGTGVPFTTVAERLKPEQLFDRFVAFRESIGMEVVPLTGGDRPPAAVLTERLEAGGCLCLLADRDLTATGVPVTFFGATAKMPAGPAALSLETGAVLVPVTLWYADARTMHCRMWPPLAPTEGGSRREQVAGLTQALADVFALGIAEHPADWHMLQRLWVDEQGAVPR